LGTLHSRFEIQSPYLETFQEAYVHLKWDEAMNKEYHFLLVNDTCYLIPLPQGGKFVKCKWVYRVKFVLYGNVGKYKARLVDKGFSQFKGLKHSKTFTPVFKIDSNHLILLVATLKTWETHHIDVNCAFLHGDMQEEI
jgi:hypothetical protein